MYYYFTCLAVPAVLIEFIPSTTTLNLSSNLYTDSMLEEKNQKRYDPTTKETLLRAKRNFARLLNNVPESSKNP